MATPGLMSSVTISTWAPLSARKSAVDMPVNSQMVSYTSTFLPGATLPSSTSQLLTTNPSAAPQCSFCSTNGWPPTASTMMSGRRSWMVATSAAVPRRRSTFRRANSSWYQRVMPAIWSRCGALAAMVICPPICSFFSNTVTSWPRSAATRAASMPAGPAPTTTTLRFGPVDFSMICGTPMYSREVAAFWMHSTSRPWYWRSMQ